MKPLSSRKPFGSWIVVLALVIICLLPENPSRGQTQNAPARPKYIFLFLSDGGGMAHLEIARQYSRYVLNEGFTIVDKVLKEGSAGIVTTHAADLLSTDSAAAATALASGCKANDGALGVCADGSLATSAMEIAHRQGMRLGLVTTAPVYDASAAAFVCHVADRRDFPAILRRYLELAPDVLLGGGRDQFMPRNQPGGRRNDNFDMIAAFVDKGYRYVRTKQELEHAPAGKLLGLFAGSDMSLELDRDIDREPSLADMTRAAIRVLLDTNPRGFFAFIESENIDSAAHLSDIVSVVHAYREFDRAVAHAYEFYRQHPQETLIVIVSDHETGGLGFTRALKDLSSTRRSNQVTGAYNDLKKLHGITISLQKAAQLLGPSPTAEQLDKLMIEHFPGFALAPDLRAAILKRRPVSRPIFADPTANNLGMMVANNTQIYWQTSTHTNQPVLVAALGVGAERFRGYYDNADFGRILKNLIEERAKL